LPHNVFRYLPGEESKDPNRPFNAGCRLFHFALTTSVAEVHDDNEQSHQHPDDWYTSPEHQRLYSIRTDTPCHSLNRRKSRCDYRKFNCKSVVGIDIYYEKNQIVKDDMSPPLYNEPVAFGVV